MKIGIHTNKSKDINFEITSKLISLGILENINIESAIPNKNYDLIIVNDTYKGNVRYIVAKTD